jgi:hypothetical protein
VVAGAPEFAWYLSFYDGVVDYDPKTVPKNARAVRVVDPTPSATP